MRGAPGPGKALAVLRASALALMSLASFAAFAEPSPEELDRARAHAQAGKAYFDEGKFEDAIEELVEARRLSPRPALLYNIAQAWARLGDDAKTSENLRAYLAEDPNAPDRASVERWLAQIDARTASPPPPTQANATLPWAISLGVASAVAGGVGLGFGASASSAYEDLRTGCGAGAGCSDDELDTARGPAITANVLFGVASTLLVSGLVVWLVGS
ncbi:MAG: hypothetical protein HYV07_05025 [Deltaproteobacteria bacterium]|nr:hypothetical protein [Deltaproteobacteria bacterium]